MRLTAAILILATACSDSRSSAAHPPSSASADSVAATVQPSVPPDTTPSGIIQRYYAAIQSRRYEDAYAFWSDSGRASGKTARDFAAGYAGTAAVRVTLSDSVRIEGAAGSQYATVPVVVDATLGNGQRQRFTGEYVVRRAIADGATAEQRKWRIYSAHLH